MAARTAFLNLLCAAARGPLWAILSVVLSPIRMGKYLFVLVKGVGWKRRLSNNAGGDKALRAPPYAPSTCERSDIRKETERRRRR